MHHFSVVMFSIYLLLEVLLYAGDRGHFDMLFSGPGGFDRKAPALSVELGTQSVCCERQCLDSQGVVSFQGSPARPWQFGQKKRGIPLGSPATKILNLSYDPLECDAPQKRQ